MFKFYFKTNAEYKAAVLSFCLGKGKRQARIFKKAQSKKVEM
jgi:hypothetical protein